MTKIYITFLYQHFDFLVMYAMRYCTKQRRYRIYLLLGKLEARAFIHAAIDRKGHHLLLSQSKLFSPLRCVHGSVAISGVVEHNTYIIIRPCSQIKGHRL